MDRSEILRWLMKHADVVLWVVIVLGGAVVPVVRGVIQAAKRKQEMEQRRARGEFVEPEATMPPPRQVEEKEEEEEDEEDAEAEREAPFEAPPPPVERPRLEIPAEWMPVPAPPVAMVRRAVVLAEGEQGEEGPAEPALSRMRPFASGLDRGDAVDRELEHMFGDETRTGFASIEGLASFAGAQRATDAEEPVAAEVPIAWGRASWRDAIVLSEILSQPVSMRLHSGPMALRF